MGNYTIKILMPLVAKVLPIQLLSDATSSKLFVYPNPSNSKFQVRYFNEPNNLQPKQIAIYNSQGALIFSGKFTTFIGYNLMNISLTKHGNGVYHIKIINADNKILATETVIVHK